MRPFRYDGQNEVRLLLKTAAISDLTGVGWFLPVTQNIRSCFRPNFVDSSANTNPSSGWNYNITCLETGSQLTVDQNGDVEYSSMNLAWVRLEHQFVQLRITVAGANGVASAPLVVALSAQSSTYSTVGSRGLTVRTNLRYSQFDYFTGNILYVDPNWLTGGCRVASRRAKRIFGTVQCCTATPGVQIDYCFKGEKSPGNRDSLQMHARFNTPGVHQICITPATAPTESADQCATYTVPGQLYFASIPTQYATANGTDGWSLDYEVTTLGREGATFELFFDQNQVSATMLTDVAGDPTGVVRITSSLAGGSEVSVEVVGTVGQFGSEKVTAAAQIVVVVLA